MAWTLVQSKSNPTTAGLEYSATAGPAVTLTATPTAGNLLLAVLYCTAVAPTITATNSFAKDVQYNGTKAIGGAAILSKIAGGSESSTVTVTTSNATGALWVGEFSGNAASSPLDQTGSLERSTAGTSLTVPTSGNLLLDNELGIAAFITGGSDGGNHTITSFTVGYQASEGAVGAYNILSGGSGSPLSAADAWPSSLQALGVIATYKPLAVASVLPSTGFFAA